MSVAQKSAAGQRSGTLVLQAITMRGTAAGLTAGSTRQRQSNAGGVVSWKLIVCTQFVVLPQPSVAVQVRKIVALPVQLVLANPSTKLMFVIALHVAVAVAIPVRLVVGSKVHSRVMSAGQTIAGGTVSLKLIV